MARGRDQVPSASNIYDMLIQSVVDYAIYMLDLDGRVMSWNPGAERIKGYRSGEIIGEHFSRFYTEEERAAGIPEAALRTAAETGRFNAEAEVDQALEIIPRVLSKLRAMAPRPTATVAAS